MAHTQMAYTALVRVEVGGETQSDTSRVWLTRGLASSATFSHDESMPTREVR